MATIMATITAVATTPMYSHIPSHATATTTPTAAVEAPTIESVLRPQTTGPQLVLLLHWRGTDGHSGVRKVENKYNNQTENTPLWPNQGRGHIADDALVAVPWSPGDAWPRTTAPHLLLLLCCLE